MMRTLRCGNNATRTLFSMVSACACWMTSTDRIPTLDELFEVLVLMFKVTDSRTLFDPVPFATSRRPSEQ